MVSMLPWPIRSARKEMSLHRSRKFLAKRCRKEWGWTTFGSMPYLRAKCLSCWEIPRDEMGAPKRFRKMGPVDHVKRQKHNECAIPASTLGY